jgi:hypothetical protein
MAWWQTVLVSLTSLVSGAMLAAFLKPLHRRLERLGRRIVSEPPIDVNVEWDQAIVRAGYPLPWITFKSFFPGELPDEPPTERYDWGHWTERNGGVELGETVLRVTVVPRTEVTVVMGTPVVRDDPYPLPDGVAAIWPAPGGAEINPRGYEINLAAPGWTKFRDPATGEYRSYPPAWKLSPGDVEQLDILVSADDSFMHEWTLELPIIVDGRRILVSAARDGQPFSTAGSQHSDAERWWIDDSWIKPPS